MRVLLFCAALLLVPAVAHAQEIQLTGPLVGASTLSEPSPPSLEWSLWTATGFATRSERNTLAVLALGIDVTRHAFKYGSTARVRRRGEVRAGPWGAAELRSIGVLGEGGLTARAGALRLDPIPFRSLPLVDLRTGIGSADYGGGVRATHLTFAIALGYPIVDHSGLSKRQNAEHAVGSFFRFVTTYRRTLDVAGAEIGLALEITPAALALTGR